MNNYYITFRSITGAQKAVKILERAGVSTAMQRTPKNMVTEGCGYAVKVREDKAAASTMLLKSSGVNYGKLFIASGGEYREVIG